MTYTGCDCMHVTVDFLKREDIYEVVKLGVEIFGEGEIVETSVLESWFNVNNFQWLIAKDKEDNVVGFLSLWHLDEESFNKLVNGEILEVEMTERNFLHFKENDVVHCHIGAFVVKGKNSRAAIGLINKAITYFKFLKDNGIIVKEVSTYPVTDSGLKLVKKLGFKNIGYGKALSDGTVPPIYVLDFDEHNVSHVINSIKEIYLDNREYL